MVSLIATYNQFILNPNDQLYGCNCRVKSVPCKCLTPGIVYQATVTNNKDEVEKIYDGLLIIMVCETAFKERNHTSSFRHGNNRNKTELSNYIKAF